MSSTVACYCRTQISYSQAEQPRVRTDLGKMIVACINAQLSVNVYARFQVVLTDNLFHKLKGLDHSIFTITIVDTGVVIFQETGSAVC